MRIAVCISTLHRPDGLARALASVAAQDLSGSGATLAEVVVVNNDPADPRPASIVAAAAAKAAVPIVLLGEQVRGTAPPRNRALAHVRGRTELIAFLDDDEEAPRAWLASLLAAMRRFDADIATGPVIPVLEATAPRWAHKLHARPRRPTGTPRPWAFTGNVLFDAALLERVSPWFDARFMQGEDRHFFARLAAVGARIVWCDEDPPHEFVPRERIAPAWFARRMFAVGRAVTAIERDTPARILSRTRNAGKGLAWIAIGGTVWSVGIVTGLGTRVRGRAELAYGVGLIAGAASGGSSPRS